MCYAQINNNNSSHFHVLSIKKAILQLFLTFFLIDSAYDTYVLLDIHINHHHCLLHIRTYMMSGVYFWLIVLLIDQINAQKHM